MLSLILALILIVAVILSLIWFYARKKRKVNTEPIIELEKLVNCKSCGSLIPEDASKCAFCGKSQTRNKPTVDQ